MEERIEIDIEKFILFHKKRIPLLRKLGEEGGWGKLIYQVSFLGIESLAKVFYPEVKNAKERFISLLSTRAGQISKNEATELWEFWRNPLTHGGFVEHWVPLEAWGEDDLAFIKDFKDDLIRAGWQFDPKTMIEIYNHIIKNLEDSWKESNIKSTLIDKYKR